MSTTPLFHDLTVRAIEPDTSEAVVVSFDVPAPLRQTYAFTQGQYLTLRKTIAGEDLRRSYSICAGVDDGELRVGVRKVAGGRFSIWINESLQPGDTIAVMAPQGRFFVPLDAAARRHHVGIAGGSGITPILSIIKTTLAAESQSSFTLVYGNRASSAVIFREELAELKDVHRERLNLVYVMSREQQDIDLFNGRITREKCERLFERWIDLADHDAAFVCGPESMMHDVSAALQAHGMPKEAIKVELFAASIPKKKAHAAQAHAGGGRQESEITLVIDGSHRSFTMGKDTVSVLDAGLEQGIDIRYSCKGGVCSTCRCKVVEGKVEMDANYALEDYEIARGFVLSCQAFPVTDRVVLDFDQDS